MPKVLQAISIVTAMSLAGAAWAQEATNTEAPAADNTTENGLSLGEPVENQAYIREEHGDWKLECYRIQAEREPCQLFQPLLGTEGNQVANVRIFRLPEGGQAVAGAVIAVPLETLLTAQLTVVVDGELPKRYPFSVCDPLGCYARIGLTQLDVDAFKRGAKAMVSLVPYVAPDKRVDLTMSLNGFTAGYGQVSAVALP